MPTPSPAQPRCLCITMSPPGEPEAVIAVADGSLAGFSTDPRRARTFTWLDRAGATKALEELRLRYPAAADRLHVRSAAAVGPR